MKYYYFIENEWLATMSLIKNFQSYRDKNRLRTLEPENWLKNRTAEPHFKKLCSYRQGRIHGYRCRVRVGRSHILGH